MALPSISCGSKAWIPRRCSVGARFSSTGCSAMTSSSTSQTSGRTARSTIRFADLMFCAWERSTRRFITNGLNSSIAMYFGRPLVQLELRARHDHRTTGVVDALAEQVLAEATLLALEHVGQRLQRPVARAGDRTA